MIRLGIIGAGNIAHRFAKSLQNVPDCTLYAISGRNEEKLKAFQEEFPCEKLYVGHENLLADEAVDCVYIALPHGLHCEWIVKAAEAHKHVLVEKPAVLNAEEALKVQEAINANNVVFMEAMKNRFTEAYAKVKESVQSGVIGELESIETHHGFALPKEMYGTSYHTSAKDGGCLYDIGCYALGFVHDFVSGKPTVIKTWTNMYQSAETYLRTQLQYDGVVVDIECAFDRNLEAYAVLHGTKGDITVAPLHRPDHYIVENGSSQRYDFPLAYDDFYDEINAFVQCVKTNTNSTIMDVQNTVDNTVVMDIIRDSFTKYDESDLNILKQQEETFTIPEFNSQLAFQIGQAIIALLPEYDLGIALQITRESDEAVVFQYITDDKKASNLMYAQGKRNAIKVFGHSSAYLNVYRKLVDIEEQWQKEKALPAGGAFPLFNAEGQLLASIAVSGLHEGKDHEIIIRALENVFQKKAVVFTKALG